MRLFPAMWVLAAAIGGIWAPQNVTPTQSSLFVTVDWLAERIGDPSLVLFHVGVKPEYDAAHIPGARFLTLDDIAARDSKLALQMPAPEELKETLEAQGVSDNSTIVVYFGRDWLTPTARVYVSLDYLGLGERAHILDGGLPAWRAAGRPVTDQVPQVTRGALNIKPRQNVVASTTWLQEHLKDPALVLMMREIQNSMKGVIRGAALVPATFPAPSPSRSHR